MKLERVRNHNNAPSFGAIEMPKLIGSNKLNYKRVSGVINKLYPQGKIKICRGISQSGVNPEYFDYVLVKEDSLEEQNIFIALSKISKKVKKIASDIADKNIKKFDDEMENFRKNQEELGDEAGILGFDDSVSKLERDKIRRMMNSDRIKFERFLEYVKKKEPVDDVNVNAIKWKYDLTGVKKVAENCYRGGPLYNHLDALVPFRKDGRIECIINLSFFQQFYAKACKQAGLKHVLMTIDNDFWRQPAFRTLGLFLDDEETRLGTKFNPQKSEERFKFLTNKFIEKDLKKFIDAMNNGYYYMHCDNGLYKTDYALALDYLFNPKCNLLEIPKIDYSTVNRMTWLYENFTTKNKMDYGWSEEFDTNFSKRLNFITEY